MLVACLNWPNILSAVQWNWKTVFFRASGEVRGHIGLPCSVAHRTTKLYLVLIATYSLGLGAQIVGAILLLGMALFLPTCLRKVRATFGVYFNDCGRQRMELANYLWGGKLKKIKYQDFTCLRNLMYGILIKINRFIFVLKCSLLS